MRCTICTSAAQTLSQDIDLSRDQSVALQACLMEKASDEFQGDGFILTINWGQASVGNFYLVKIGMSILPDCLMLC